MVRCERAGVLIVGRYRPAADGTNSARTISTTADVMIVRCESTQGNSRMISNGRSGLIVGRVNARNSGRTISNEHSVLIVRR